MTYIGNSIPKVDGLGVVKGLPAYTSDLDTNNNALVVKLLRSPHAHARIIKIDCEEARDIPGVECVLIYKDVPDTKFTLAGQSYPEPSPYDRKILGRTVRYVGDEVAIVAAVDEDTAEIALSKIKVKYEILPAVLDFATAIDNETCVHSNEPFTNFPIGNFHKRNIAASQDIGVGDVESELASSDVTVDETYFMQAQAHCMMETYRASTCIDVNGRLQIMTSTQIPYHIRRHLAYILDMPKSQIKILKPRVGGGFGGKQTAPVEIYPALVTKLTGKPAKIVYTREETFTSTTSRHAMQLRVKLGADREGNIKAIDIETLSDTGAYGEHAATVFWVVGQKTLPLYGKAKACRYHGHAVYTNKTPAGAFRGYGATQGTFALESAINELAAKLKMDPAELRLKNILQEGETHPMLCGSLPDAPATLASSSLAKCIKSGVEKIGWKENFPGKKRSIGKARGYGMAVTMQGSGINNIDSASVILKLNEDGFFTLSHSAADIGQGSDTVLSQFVASELEIDISFINSTSFDLDTLPYDPGAYASSGTYVTGNAAVLAAKDMIEQLRETAAKYMDCSVDEVKYKQAELIGPNLTMNLSEIAMKLCSYDGRGQLIGQGTFGGPNSPPPFIAGFAEVEVDLQTGETELLNFVNIVDCGTVINENLARIQVESGTVMGIGLALFEEVRYSKKGRLTTNSFMEYRIPSREDVGEIEVHFEPSFEPSGPHGAKSIGEVVCNSAAPAITAAIANATGFYCRSLPASAEKVLFGLSCAEG
ncbi:MAG: molybdopterin-dependent oxidoreductase [Desulfotalea sp.]